MTKNKKTTQNNNVESIDLSKIEIPANHTINNKKLIDVIMELNFIKSKENKNFPFIGVNEIANFLNESNNLSIDGKFIRRKLQKIRRKSDLYNKFFVGKKSGKIIVDRNDTINKFDTPLFIQWVDKNDRTKGIFYLITPIEESNANKIIQEIKNNNK